MTKNQILEIVDNCHFEKFSKQEENEGYIDQTIQNRDLKKKFFNLGPKNDWKNHLDKNIKDEIENNFREEMKELNYL